MDYQDISPLDHFQNYSIPIYDWLLKTDYESSPQEKMDYLNKKCKAFHDAYLEFKKGTLIDNLRAEDHLRHICYVVENYSVVTEDVKVTFIFKLDNNGCTFRIPSTFR